MADQQWFFDAWVESLQRHVDVNSIIVRFRSDHVVDRETNHIMLSYWFVAMALSVVILTGGALLRRRCRRKGKTHLRSIARKIEDFSFISMLRFVSASARDAKNRDSGKVDVRLFRQTDVTRVYADKSMTKVRVEFVSYCPRVFENLRNVHGVSLREISASFRSQVFKQGQGKSGSGTSAPGVLRYAIVVLPNQPFRSYACRFYGQRGQVFLYQNDEPNGEEHTSWHASVLLPVRRRSRGDDVSLSPFGCLQTKKR